MVEGTGKRGIETTDQWVALAYDRSVKVDTAEGGGEWSHRENPELVPVPHGRVWMCPWGFWAGRRGHGCL